MFGCCLALSLCHPAISKTSSPSRSAISVVPVPEFSDWAPLCHTPRTIQEPSLSPAIPTGLFSITAAEVRGPVSAGLMVLAASWLAALPVMLLQYSSLELRNFFYHTIPDCLTLFLADCLSHGKVVITTNDVIRPNLPFALST
ncbi:hypothetical protein KUCAC02_012476 [Chaenocephalus aceratus]|uniref:Uncharacterized protein n=1 Tax=Chaenocephalus aceratus TaxID=36190 RepID=A0ACB9XAU2_CHAAC|nr:hypothetical protein KUCAC02_012476 [Chaenocephalus aceratus]